MESPCFFDNCKELSSYLKDMEVAGMLVAYHGAGASFLADAAKYATKNAVVYSENGGGMSEGDRRAVHMYRWRYWKGIRTALIYRDARYLSE